MPKQAKRQRKTRQKQVKDVLESADQSKKQRFRQKLREFMQEREWSRDTWQQDLKDLENTLETVEELITDLQTDLNKLEGRGDFNDEKERIMSEYGQDNLKDLQEKGNSRFTPYLKELHDIEEQKTEKYRKMLEWKEYENLLKEVGKRKLENVATKYKNDYQDSEVAKRMLDYLDQKQEIFEDKLETEIDTKVDRKFTEMEGRLNQLEKDVDRFDKRLTSFRSMIEDLITGLSGAVQQNSVIDKISDKLENMDKKKQQSEQEKEETEEETKQQTEEVEEASPQETEEIEEAFEDEQPLNTYEEDDTLTADDIGLDENELAEIEEDEEEEDTAEPQDDFEPFDEEELPLDISEDDVHTQYKKIGRLKETVDFDEKSQGEIADLLGVPRPTLLNNVLAEVYSEYGTVFGITTRDYGDQ